MGSLIIPGSSDPVDYLDIPNNPLILSSSGILGAGTELNGKRTKDYYKGTSFRDRGKWRIIEHYFNNEFNVDYVYYENALLRCLKTHDSSLDNEPVLIKDSEGKTIGVEGDLWWVSI